MIRLNKLNGEVFILNCELVETIQATPDTTIRLTTGNIYIVQQSVDDIIEATVQYKQGLFENMLRRDEA